MSTDSALRRFVALLPQYSITDAVARDYLSRHQSNYAAAAVAYSRDQAEGNTHDDDDMSSGMC